MILDFTEDLSSIQNLLGGSSICDILHDRCNDDLRCAVNDLVRKASSVGTIHFDYLISPDIANALPLGNDKGWMLISEYCARHALTSMKAPHQLLEALLVIFQPPEAEAWIAPGILLGKEPLLQFDKDDLAYGPPSEVSFASDGMLTARHWIRYDKRLPGAYKTGGFVDDLIGEYQALAEAASRPLAIAVNYDALLSREYHDGLITRAYIRGAIGLPLALLQDPGFPENPKGSVTVHQRIDASADDLFPLERIEVMWSLRDGIKSVQIEELIPLESGRNRLADGQVCNRFVHAQWNPREQRFIHFDGSVMIYEAKSYQERLGTDMKKFGGKASSKKKLFRLDGPLQLPAWCRLVTKYFEENELIAEYLGGAT